MPTWMLYGATGYTGRLIAAEAARRGLRPVLAGRSRDAVTRLGEETGLETRVFDLADAGTHLAGIDAVLHCAGPFVETSRTMLDACIANHAHYLDITGELDVFEAIYARSDELVAAGICAIPGVGFDVVPSDCLAAMLKDALPDATSLDLAIGGVAGASSGTAKSALGIMAHGGRVRRDGRIVEVPIAQRTVDVPLPNGHAPAISIPLADVASAYLSTGIPNITGFMCVEPWMGLAAPVFAPVLQVLAAGPVRGMMENAIDRLVKGPDQHARETVRTTVWGAVSNARGERVAMRMLTPEPYALTVASAIAAAERVAAGEVPPGASTPAKAFGPDFVRTLGEVEVIRLA